MENFNNPAQICRDFNNDPVLQQLLSDAPVAGARYRGLRVEAVFTSESEITTNAEEYIDYAFSCIVSVNDISYAMGKRKDNPMSVILPEIDHSVTYAGKVIFAGIA
jgi:hypothetical protein